MRKLTAIGLILGVRVLAQNTCVNYPSGLIPFSSIAYVTAANFNGDHLVVGTLANGSNSLALIPPSAGGNQIFCDSSVQLAGQQFYPNVYVPTAAERGGNFSAFAGLVFNPTTGQFYGGGIIPASQLDTVFAFRIEAVRTTGTSGGFNPTGSMAAARQISPYVVLPSGKVFVVAPGGSSVAELYDPSTGVFTPAGPTLFPHGEFAGATLLNDGRVLIQGGSGAASDAELYDPATNRFTATGKMVSPHGFGQTATLLQDGRVLVVAGIPASGSPITANDASSNAELYDPATGVFTRTGSLGTDRQRHKATLLPNGKVLISGGANGPFGTGPSTAECEIYDPATGQFSSTGKLLIARHQHFAVVLPNGKVFVGAGFGDSVGTTELYDPATGVFSFAGNLLVPRASPTATVLSNGQVLIAGGFFPFPRSTFTAELYNPSTNQFTFTGSMGIARGALVSVLLRDGRVLVAGGALTNGLTGQKFVEVYTPASQGLVPSQTGLTFRAPLGAGVLPSQTVVALSATDTIPYNVTVKTFTGGGWLKATPSSGTSGPASAPVILTVTGDATGLAASDYYGVVTLTPTDGKHPPVSISIVLTVIPAGTAAAPGVTPTGLVFLTPAGTSAATQTFAISNVTSSALTFTAAAISNTNFFDFTPKTGSINARQSQTITVNIANASPAAGVSRGSIKLTFSDNSTQTVDVLLVASANGCTPNRLLPVLTSIGTGFSPPLAWPAPIIGRVVDNCGTPFNTGNVTVSFTNGDPPLSLVALGNGIWSATWVPVHINALTGVRLDAQTIPLAGTVQVNGQVGANPKTPVVATGGVLSSGDYIGSPAQGLLASIFGLALADSPLGNSSLPLPLQLGSTSVTISGVQIPVLYVSENQVNVFIPFELAVNAPHQLTVQRANAISVPVPIAVFENQPAILATAGNGAGQGHIYRINSAGLQILADTSAPAKAGDVLVIYTVGLGPVNPPLKSGDPAPLSFLEPITGTAAVTIGGVSAKVEFAGLTPGFSGLYQVNVTVPTGITAGNQVPVTVSVNGRAGAGNIFMAVQ